MKLYESHLPPHLQAAIDRYRKVSQPAEQMVYDGENGVALVVATKTNAGLSLVVPIVVAIPLGDVLIFAANMMQLIAPQLRSAKVPEGKPE